MRRPGPSAEELIRRADALRLPIIRPSFPIVGSHPRDSHTKFDLARIERAKAKRERRKGR